MAAIRNALNIHALRPSLAKLTIKSFPFPPIPIETYFKDKPSIGPYAEMVEIPPLNYMPEITTPSCKENPTSAMSAQWIQKQHSKPRQIQNE